MPAPRSASGGRDDAAAAAGAPGPDDEYTYWVISDCPYPDECTQKSWKRVQRCVSYHSAEDS